MLYFIALEIKGDPVCFYKKLNDHSYRYFGIEPLYQRMPFHITLKPPFRYIGDPSFLIDVVGESVSGFEPFGIHLASVGHFGNKVIFVLPQPVSPVIHLQRSIESKLSRTLPEFKKDGDKEKGNQTKRSSYKPHASLVRFLGKESFPQVWQMAQKWFPERGWHIYFSEVSLFVNSKGRWEKEASITLG